MNSKKIMMQEFFQNKILQKIFTKIFNSRHAEYERKKLIQLRTEGNILTEFFRLDFKPRSFFPQKIYFSLDKLTKMQFKQKNKT